MTPIKDLTEKQAYDIYMEAVKEKYSGTVEILDMDDNSDDRPVQFVESERDGFEAFNNY